MEDRERGRALFRIGAIGNAFGSVKLGPVKRDTGRWLIAVCVNPGALCLEAAPVLRLDVDVGPIPALLEKRVNDYLTWLWTEERETPEERFWPNPRA